MRLFLSSLLLSIICVVSQTPVHATESYVIAEYPFTIEDNSKEDSICNVPKELITPRVLRGISITTNSLPWAATIMNAGIEFEFTDHISLSIPVMWCPWFITDRNALRILGMQPVVKWWFGEMGKGHFLGPHMSMAQFNIKHGDIRSQDSGYPAIGGGLTYGYCLVLKGAWQLRFSLGLGYLSLKYDRYHNVNNGASIDRRSSSYFGLDHASIEFAYRFNL